MRRLFDDVRFARRLFSRRRRFAALLVATIALGLGSATAIFSLVDGVMWKPLPYRDAERLYWVARTSAEWRASPVFAAKWDKLGHTLADYLGWAAAQRSFDGVGAWFATSGVLSTSDGLERISAGRATASLLPLLGAKPVAGRWFLPGEDGRSAARVAVLSFESWRRRFGADSTIIGRAVTVNGQPFEVVGVLPRGFRLVADTGRVEVWTPAGTATGDLSDGNFNFRVVGLLRPGVSADAAVLEATRLLARDHRGDVAGIRLERLHTEATSAVREPLVLVLGCALLLLAIACGNVASLLLAEASARHVEIATRMSLGASRGRIVGQVLTENGLLALVGGAIGAGLAWAAVGGLRAVAPADLPRIDAVRLDERGLLFALVVTGVTAVIFSLSPLALMLRQSPACVLSARSSRASPRLRLERAGVFVQAALVVVLLVGAALLVATHRRLIAVDPGFRASGIVGIELRLFSLPRYRDAARRNALFDELASRARALPGVVAASFGHAVPFQSVSGTGIRVGGSPVIDGDEEVAATYVIAGPGYLETMGIALRAGRLFDATENGPGSSAIVSETMARRLWPNASAIGRRIRVDARWREIVGVVADVRHRSLDEQPRETFYLPATQAPERPGTALVVRTAGDPVVLIPSLRRLVAQYDPAIAIDRADRLSDLVARTLIAERFRTTLLGFFAAAATLLAAIGIAGVSANAVARRTKELAIRMTVGATPAVALHLVLAGTLVVALSGAVVGVGLALAATRALRPFLYGITSVDPVSYGASLAIVLLVAALAAWIPARRASRIELARTLAANA